MRGLKTTIFRFIERVRIFFRNMATSTVDEYKWIVLDGPADPAWIGQYNTNINCSVEQKIAWGRVGF